MTRDLRKPTHNPTLEDAWRLFATYDLNSKLTSYRFTRIRWISLILGVVATSLALLYEIILPENEPIMVLGLVTLYQIVGFLVVLLPISVSVLLTILSKLDRGENWILLRGTAEAIKHEIFKFRSRTGIYSNQSDYKESREIRLARRIKSINERLMLTDINQSNLKPYTGILPPPIDLASSRDDGFSFLTASQYYEFRLADQIKWYKKRTNQMDRRINQLQYQIILFGALGTLLAALGFAVWIYITTAVVGAITNYMEFYQYEKIITSYNLAASDLQNVRIWWRAIPEYEKNTPVMYERLVNLAEEVMQDESQRWTHTIRDALEKLEDETRQSLIDSPIPSLPLVPEDTELPPVNLTPEDILAGNWGGSPLSPEDYFEEPSIESQPQADVFPSTPKIEDPIPSSEVEELLDLSSDELDDLDDLVATDQGKGALFPEEPKDYDSDTPDLATEVTMTEDFDLPFGDVQLSDEDVIVDDFVPGETTSGDSADYKNESEG